VVPEHILNPPPMKRNFSDTFVDIIEDYVPERREENLETEFELSGCNNASENFTTASTNEEVQPCQGHFHNESSYLIKSKSMSSIFDLSTFGWKVYDYIEYALGLKEEGIYEPKFEENSSRDCVECSWNSSEGGLLKGFDGILRGFRVCALCSKTFCYSHCSYRRRLVSTAEKEANRRHSMDLETDASIQNSWMLVCKKCYEKGETQDLGQTRDHTSSFVKLRAKKNNVMERRQDKIIRNLEKLSKKVPQQGDSFSIWNLSNALPSAQEFLKVGDSARKTCTICDTQFSFWVKHQSCQLCSNLCCTTCCNFSVPLAKSAINPNGRQDRQGEVLACKHCYHLINLKKKRIVFSQDCNSEQSNQRMKQYEYIVALKKEIDKHLSDYLEKTEILETSILDHFQLVPKTKREESASVNFSDPVRSGSQKQLEKMKPLFLEYQKSVGKLLEMPALNKRAKLVLNNIRTSFQQAEGYVLLSQKISN